MTDKKMKHLWMVEDYQARGERPAGSYWTKIGVAFENKDGSWSLEMKAIPVNGRLQMRDPAPKQDKPEATEAVQ
jgi:hypothetical protein